MNALLSARIHVIGASGRSGTALCRALRDAGTEPVPVIRSLARWQATGLAGSPRLADVTDRPALEIALAGATHVVCCAHARHAQNVLAAAPETASFVFLGSTRRFSRWPDDHGNGVRSGEAAFLASGRAGVILHPTMIYGAQGEDNVRRLAALLRILPAVPLSGGGRALVQPIHQDDLTACILAALRIEWTQPEILVVAGPEPVTYAAFVRAIAEASCLRKPMVFPMPSPILQAAAWLARCLPGLPKIQADEIRRLLEDKAFDITPMRQRLGVTPRSLKDGLSAVFAEHTCPA